MLVPHWKTALATALCIAYQTALAQAPSGVVLRIDLKNFVVYQIDVSDPAKLATDPGIVRTAAPARPFASFESIADVVAVNGQPVKGTWVDRAGWVKLSLTRSLVRMRKRSATPLVASLWNGTAKSCRRTVRQWEVSPASV